MGRVVGQVENAGYLIHAFWSGSIDDVNTVSRVLDQYASTTASAGKMMIETARVLSTDRHFTIFGIPVEIQVEEDDGSFLVTDSEINMYGTGSTRREAEEDYKSVILEYFELLNENEGKLSEHLRRHLYYLRGKEPHFGAT